MAATTRGAVEGRRVIPHPKQTSPFGRPGAVWAAWAQLALCREETPGPYGPGDIPKLTPPAPGAPGLRRRKEQSFRAASWPLGKADQACALSLPQDPGHRQAAGVTGEGRGLVSVGGQGSRWSILLLGLTYLHRLLARALLVRGMERRGGRLVFRRLPACHLQWLLPTCRPGKHRSEPSGERRRWRPEASLSLQGAESVPTALSPRYPEHPPRSPS